MNHADALLAGILEMPNDPAPWLVMSDWLEEQGDPTNAVRAELLRIQTQRAAAHDDPPRQKELDVLSREILIEHPELVAGLEPLLGVMFPVLSAPSALAMFLLADLTSVVEEPFAAGTTWVGELKQDQLAFPTVMEVRQRERNQFTGDMVEDFSSLFGPGATGKFYFRGVIVGRSHVAFVTYQMEDIAAGPGLYQFRLNRLRRLNGTWQVGTARHGKMWLKQKRNLKRGRATWSFLTRSVKTPVSTSKPGAGRSSITTFGTPG